MTTDGESGASEHRRLAKLPLSRLVNGTVEAIQAGDDDARWDYVVALHVVGSPEVFQIASDWCRDDRANRRRLGADVLGQLGGSGSDNPYRSRSVPILRGLLADDAPEVLNAALIALGHLAVRDGTEDMIGLVGHSEAQVRHGLVHALAGNDAPRAVETLITLTRDPDDDIRNWATFSIGSQTDLDTPDLRDALLARATDRHDETRGEALVGLARRSDARVLLSLVKELKAASVGTLAVEAARDLGAPECIKPLKDLRSWWDVDEDLLAEAIESCSKTVDKPEQPE